MKNKTPLVSVVMPVRNADDFLCAAIESILNQTYKNLELIIINDASTDGTSKLLNFYKKSDKRVRIFTNKVQLGVSKSASLGISKARGVFVARMDADDIAYPTRLEKQVTFLQNNQKAVAVGGQCDLIDKNGIKFGEKRFPTSDKAIRGMIFSSVPLQQPTLVVNQALLPKDFVWYDEDYSSAEELELLFKLFKFGEVRNLPGKVLKYRIHDNNTSLKNPKKTFYLTLKTRLNAIVKYGYTPTLKGILTTLVQAVFISLVPSSWIYPIYSHLRGMRRLSWCGVKIDRDVNGAFKKAFQLAKA
jgi:glycosyltransferase involved in cell wall biosynthesis